MQLNKYVVPVIPFVTIGAEILKKNITASEDLTKKFDNAIDKVKEALVVPKDWLNWLPEWRKIVMGGAVVILCG